MRLILSLITLVAFSTLSYGHIDPNRKANKPKVTTTELNFREDCLPAERQIDQNINNVRARLNTGGDVWWDLQDGKYIVPQPAPGELEKSSIFAGGVWIGGTDPQGNLKLAGVTYRNGTSNDFYTGPLDPETGGTDKAICEDWDRFFTVQGDEIRNIINLYNQSVATGEQFPCDSVTDNVLYWPGKGNGEFLDRYEFDLPNTGQGLGSFWDEDQDGNYNPCNGDFPIIEIRDCEPANRAAATELVPDEMIFWIYNDAGGVHSETMGDAINMEVQVQSFAYATNDEINDMTFQRYKLINRAQDDIQDCYFAMWVDPDLGCYSDDYIGCDVERSLAYVYNEDALDGDVGITCPGGVNTYEDEVPILGVDYFRGPLSPKIFNSEGELVTPPLGYQGLIDAEVEEGMTSFIYMNNASIGNPPPATTDPAIAEQYYNYLLGNWRDGTAVTAGGSGYTPGSTDTVKYVFPSDPSDGSGWSMCTADLPFGDRRTLQATGPLLLQPQAVNELIIGVVWVPNQDYPCPNISELQNADDLAQDLFDRCFDIIDGPDAPDVCLVELDREIILVLSNDEITSNNKFESYSEVSPLVPEDNPDSLYVFEGYQVYQLAEFNVTPQELDDIERARLIRQVDIKNDVSQIFNWTAEIDPFNGTRLWTANSEVEGENEGIRNTFRITSDQFADGDSRLVNHKPYYFMVTAYGHNNFDQFSSITELGQRNPYLQGRGNIRTYTALPRPIVYEELNSAYGDGPIVTRLDGSGTGNSFVQITDESRDAILEGTANGEITYVKGAGPVNVSIYNPLEVVDGEFILEVTGDYNDGICDLSEDARWKMTETSTGREIASMSTLEEVNEQLISEYGFSVTIGQEEEPGVTLDESNGVIGGSINYADASGSNWLSGLGDDTNIGLGFAGAYNYIKTNNGEKDEALDPSQAYSNLNGSSFFNPFMLADWEPGVNGFVDYITPAWLTNAGQGFIRNGFGLEYLNNVDIVFTSDKSKWSRCVVVEMGTSQNSTEGFNTVGEAEQFELRMSDSVGKDGNSDGDGQGMGWFPGYAIDVITGKRLNIFFGENSIYNSELAQDLDIIANGDDMIFNPSNEVTSQAISDSLGGLGMSALSSGGQHFIYVTRQEYDECEFIRETLSKNFFIQKLDAFQLINWAGLPILAPDTELLSVEDGLIPNDVTVSLRVTKPYGKENVTDAEDPLSCNPVGGLPRYRLNFEGTEAKPLEDSEYEGALANVAAVPNPYYASSSYEVTQFTNTVKITNLPDRADVTIYSLDGKFIRQFRRDEVATNKPGTNPGITQGQTTPDLEWNLKNYAGIPIASGVYIIHVVAPELGEERTIKWFGINRQFDPTGL